jgi:hypothetical protein
VTTEQQSHTASDEQKLTVVDYLSHGEALEFWRRYFGNNIQV